MAVMKKCVNFGSEGTPKKKYFSKAGKNKIEKKVKIKQVKINKIK